MVKKIKRLLTRNEKILRDARVHWIVFVPPLFYILIGLAIWVYYHPFVGGAVFFISLYPIYNAVIHYTMTHLVLTNKKVLARIGFLTRDWIQMSFEKIENAYLEEPIIGRLLGYSTVIVSGVGAGTIAVPHVRNGYNFIRALEIQLEKENEN